LRSRGRRAAAEGFRHILHGRITGALLNQQRGVGERAAGIVDQPRLPRFKAWTNYDKYVGVGTWTKIGLNNTDTNDQGAFDAANNHFVAPVDGTYLFGATLLYKINASATARMLHVPDVPGFPLRPGARAVSAASHAGSLAGALALPRL
jgi:hypothetical protein